MKFLNDYYQRNGRAKFLSKAAILAFISDVLNISYINMYFLQEKISIRYLQNLYATMGADPRMFNTAYLQELRQVFINSISFVFLGFLIYHTLVYYMLSRDKKWARKYVSGYAFTGAILTVFELPGLFSDHVGWALAMLATTMIYIFVFMGLRYFKKKAEPQT